MKNKKLYLFMIIFVLVNSIAYSANVKKIIKKFQKTYQNKPFIEVVYDEVVELKISGTKQKNFGLLIMSEKNQFKLKTELQDISMDGKNYYRWNKQNNQLIIDFVKKTDETLFFQKIFYNIEDNFYLNLLDEIKIKNKKIFVIKFTPKREGDNLFKEIKVWLLDKTFNLIKLEMIDLNENKTTYNIKKLNLNKKFKTEDFQIKGDEKTEVVDLTL